MFIGLLSFCKGGGGFLFTHEEFAVGLEGAVMAIALLAFNFCNPGGLVWKEVDESNGQ